MSQRDQIVQSIQKAGTLAEQAALVSQLDAYDRERIARQAQVDSIDLAAAIVTDTLSPVAVHERSTAETDWLGEVTASSEGYANEISAEAALWFGRTSDEVKADRDEFYEQARGMARNASGKYGEQAQAAEAQFVDYVGFLHTQAASGLDQVQQEVDSFENPKATPLPQDVFDTFGPPVHPINEGVSGTEDSNRAPLLNQIEQTSGPQVAQPDPSHHDTTPEPYTYAEVPPNDAGRMADAVVGPERTAPSKRTSQHRTAVESDTTTCGECNRSISTGNKSSVNSDHAESCSLHPSPSSVEGSPKWASVEPDSGYVALNPSVAINHVANLDDMREQFAREAAEKEAASGLDQVQQEVDPFENPKPTPLPEEVAYPWELDDQDEQDQKQASLAPFQRRAAYVAGLVDQPYETLTDLERKEVRAFAASLQTRADQWSQPHQMPQPDVANGPDTTPEPPTGSYPQGYAEGTSDWPEEAPTYSDAASAAPDFVRGHAQGYGDAAQADPTAGSAQPGMLPPGGGGIGTYQTHSGSLATTVTSGGTVQVQAAYGSPVQCDSCGKSGKPWEMTQRGTGHDVKAFCTDCVAKPTENAKARWQGSLQVSASFTSPMETADPQFTKGYRYAAKWTPKTPLVKRGSVPFEAGLYAGMSDNPDHQRAWVTAHEKAAAKYADRTYIKRLRMHREFTKKAARDLQGLAVVGCYLQPEPLQATAATMTDLDSVAPSTSPSPTGSTPINGPGQPGPLAGQADPAAPGGPSPYNGAEPYGGPVVPNQTVAHGSPTAIDTQPGSPVDQAAYQHLSPQTRAFRRAVQANLLQPHQGE